MPAGLTMVITFMPSVVPAGAFSSVIPDAARCDDPEGVLRGAAADFVFAVPESCALVGVCHSAGVRVPAGEALFPGVAARVVGNVPNHGWHL